MTEKLTDLIEVSRRYGGDPEWVLAGGGNTSLKEDGRMWVKASGFELSTIGPDGFVEIDLERLNRVWEHNYPADEAAREAAVLEDMMGCRGPGQKARPSVEALLHSLIRGRLVVHTHPALINGLTCGKDGEALTKEIFKDEALWVPLTRPGYILAAEIRSRLQAAESAGRPYPEMILLQNHGLFVAGETPADIELSHNRIAAVLRERLDREPEAGSTVPAAPEAEKFGQAAATAWGRTLEVRSAVNRDILDLAASGEAFEAVRLPFNPDQIVYAGPGPLRIDDIGRLADAVAAYKEQWKREPQAVLVRGSGLYAVGDTPKKADSALSLMLDAVKISVFSESFGGGLPMTEELIIFIRDWEVEHYRSKVGK